VRVSLLLSTMQEREERRSRDGGRLLVVVAVAQRGSVRRG
jgi:hypothetical protein